MKNVKQIAIAAALVCALGGGIVWASDHADAPAVKGKSTDITDLYVFQSPTNSNNMVFVGNVQGLMSPATTATASFDENTEIEFKIDNNADNVEDLVIQCVYKAGKMYIYGPVKPSTTGLTATIVGTAAVVVPVTPYGQAPVIATSADGSIQAFAGPRDDPFFFDLNQFHAILGGTATSFNNPGTDSFAGTNVMSVVIELPKAKLNSTGKIGVWLRTAQNH